VLATVLVQQFEIDFLLMFLVGLVLIKKF